MPEDWLNDAVKGLLPDRSEPIEGSTSFTTRGLHVGVVSAEYLFVMKAQAARQETDGAYLGKAGERLASVEMPVHSGSASVYENWRASMDAEFGPAAIAIVVGDLDALGELLSADPELALRESSCSHPTLLQLVACEEMNIADPVGAARLLVDAGAETFLPLVAAAGCNSTAIVDFLLNSGTSVDREDVWTPLDEALYWSNRDMAALLVDRGAEVRSLRAAAGLGATELVEGFFENGSLTAEAGPVRSPFPDTVPKEVANDHAAIVDNAFVMAINNGCGETARQLYRRRSAGQREGARLSLARNCIARCCLARRRCLGGMVVVSRRRSQHPGRTRPQRCARLGCPSRAPRTRRPTRCPAFESYPSGSLGSVRERSTSCRFRVPLLQSRVAGATASPALIAPL